MEATASPTGSSGTQLALNEIQGNLAGFFKAFQRFVFLRFHDKATAQGFIHAVIPQIDTCDDIMKFRDSYRWNKDRHRTLPTSRWFNLVLSPRALDLLEAPERELFEQAFRDGMRARALALGDVDSSA